MASTVEQHFRVLPAPRNELNGYGGKSRLIKVAERTPGFEHCNPTKLLLPHFEELELLARRTQFSNKNWRRLLRHDMKSNCVSIFVRDQVRAASEQYSNQATCVSSHPIPRGRGTSQGLSGYLHVTYQSRSCNLHVAALEPCSLAALQVMGQRPSW